MRVGIDKINLAVPHHYIDMVELAKTRGVDPDKFTIGIGQDRMSYALPNEDAIAMAANAAEPILTSEDKEQIDQVIFATESGVDYSKSGATFLMELLVIQPFARAFEIKQACYGATAGLLNACDYVALRADRKVLIIASDIAKYGLNTGGEVTQGAGAVAMLVSANPQLLNIERETVAKSYNEHDFWRPNDQPYPLVDGKYSTELYIQMFHEVLAEMIQRYPDTVSQYQTLICHTPFTKMGRKAMVAAQSQLSEPWTSRIDQWLERYDASVRLNRQVGNIYTGSLFLSLISLLIHGDLHVHDKIGLFSYGSGAVAEMFTAEVVNPPLDMIADLTIEQKLNQREKLSIEDYEAVYDASLEDASWQSLPTSSGFYLAEIKEGRRIYQSR